MTKNMNSIFYINFQNQNLYDKNKTYLLCTYIWSKILSSSLNAILGYATRILFISEVYL